ncbi:MAG: hypothetical protein U0841_28395 [Chloroflexia bacterium]
MAYLQDFAEGWAGLTRTDGSIGIAPRDAALFPTAWLWQELEASMSPPWFAGRGWWIEPRTSWAWGTAWRRLRSVPTQLRLRPGERRETTLRLHVCTGLSEIEGVRDGRAF